MGGNASSKLRRRRRGTRGYGRSLDNPITLEYVCSSSSQVKPEPSPSLLETTSFSDDPYESYCFDASNVHNKDGTKTDQCSGISTSIDIHEEAGSSSDSYVGGTTFIKERNPIRRQTVSAIPVQRTPRERTISERSELESHTNCTLSQSDLGIPSYKVSADRQGGTFYSKELFLYGTIPEEAVDEELTLCFCKEDSSRFASELKPCQRFISDIFHILPHGMTFDKEIILRFPHKSNKHVTFRNSVPCVRIRRKVLYSPTRVTEQHRWEEIATERTAESYRQDIRAAITAEEACLILRRFCSFVAIEEEIRTKYITVQVFGQGFDGGSFKLTLNFHTHERNPLQMSSMGSVLLDEHDMCLVADIDAIKVNVTSKNPTDWSVTGNLRDKVIKTHFLWNDRSQHVTYFIHKSCQSDNESVYVDVQIEHDESLDIPLLLDLKQMRTSLTPRADGSRLTRTTDDKMDVLKLESPQNPQGAGETATPTGSQADKMNGKNKTETPYTSLQLSLKSNESNEAKSNTSGPQAQRVENIRTGPCASVEGFDTHRPIPTPPIQKLVVNILSDGAGQLACGLTKMSRLTKPKLSHFKKIELSRKLERHRIDGKDWRALAEKMGLYAYESIIENERSGPTRCLLNIWESEDGPRGTVDFLVDCLKDIGRDDAVIIITQEVG